MDRFSVPQPYRLLVFGAAAIALVTTGLIVGVSKKMGRNVLKQTHFSCTQFADQQTRQWFWTVTYRASTSTTPQPWLKIIPGVEGEKTLQRRCEEVTERLNVLYPEQLQTVLYQANPATPDRQRICVRTAEQSAPDCHTLLILKPETSSEQLFAEMTAHLQTPMPTEEPTSIQSFDHGASASYNTSSPAPSNPVSIDLRLFLEDQVP